MNEHKLNETARVDGDQRLYLGACLVDSDECGFLDRFLELTTVDDRNREIAEAMKRLMDEGQDVDWLTVMAELKAIGKLTEVGGPGYLAELASAADPEWALTLAGKRPPD